MIECKGVDGKVIKHNKSIDINKVNGLFVSESRSGIYLIRIVIDRRDTYWTFDIAKDQRFNFIKLSQLLEENATKNNEKREKDWQDSLKNK